MNKDYKYGLILGLILAGLAMIWLSARSGPNVNSQTPNIQTPAIAKTDENFHHINLNNSTDPVEAKKFHIVKHGESLSDIAQRYYGSSKLWKKIYKANRTEIEDVNRIKPATKLIIPDHN